MSAAARLVAVVGAGPAGLAAAQSAADAGTPVLLIDAAATVGGQYARQAGVGPARVRQVADPRIEHLPNTSVWAIERGSTGICLHLRSGPADAPDRTGRVVNPAALVLATGAYDRPIPFPGWDLPGVFTAGAAQALAKGQQVAVGQRVLVGGTGPFLLPVATALLAAGSTVAGVLEANSVARSIRAWTSQPATLWAGRHKVAELTGYLATLAAHRVAYRHRTAVVGAHGDDRVRAVTIATLNPDWTIRAGSRRRVEIDAVCLGYGFVPQLECAIAAGCALDGGFVRVDGHQATTVAGVFAAGELTGIGGADLAAAEGAVAGHAAAAWVLGTPPVPGWDAETDSAVAAGRRFAAALARAYPIRPGWRTWLTEDTLVCRCEEVTLGQLRFATARLGPTVSGPRSIKLASRVGLGRCQGRICGRAVADLVPGLEPTFADRRPVATPVRLGELAGTPLAPMEQQVALDQLPCFGRRVRINQQEDT